MENDNSEWIIITNIDRDIYAWCPDRAILLKLNSARWKTTTPSRCHKTLYRANSFKSCQRVMWSCVSATARGVQSCVLLTFLLIALLSFRNSPIQTYVYIS